METSKWIVVGICAVEVVAHLLWVAHWIRWIAKMSKELDEDKGDDNV